MKDELVFVVNENNKPLKPQPRHVMINKGLYCRVSSVTVVNPEKTKVLCQKRSELKDQRPGLWVAEFGGKSNPGEKSIITAQRELAEESGIVASLAELKFYGLQKSETIKQFASYYYLERPFDTPVSPDPLEVSKIEWVAIKTAIKNLESSKDWYAYDLDIDLLKSLVSA